MLDERIVRFRPRAILTVIGVVLAVAIVLEVIWVTRSVIIWVLIALFLAMALNPAVEFLVRARHEAWRRQSASSSSARSS